MPITAQARLLREHILNQTTPRLFFHVTTPETSGRGLTECYTPSNPAARHISSRPLAGCVFSPLTRTVTAGQDAMATDIVCILSWAQEPPLPHYLPGSTPVTLYGG